MRTLPIVLSLLLFACAISCDGTYPATARPARANLLDTANAVQSRAIAATTRGAWQFRGDGPAQREAGTTYRGPAGGVPASHGPTTGSRDFYLGSVRSDGPAGPSAPAPSGPATGGPAGP